MKFSTHKDYHKLAAEYAAKPGWTSKAQHRGHAKVIAPNGRSVPIPATPSDTNGILALRSLLKRLDRECAALASGAV